MLFNVFKNRLHKIPSKQNDEFQDSHQSSSDQPQLTRVAVKKRSSESSTVLSVCIEEQSKSNSSLRYRNVSKEDLLEDLSSTSYIDKISLIDEISDATNYYETNSGIDSRHRRVQRRCSCTKYSL